MPTEDQIIEWMQELGKDPTDFLGTGPGDGMNMSEAEGLYNHVLGKYGLGISCHRHSSLNREQVKEALNTGRAVVVSNKLNIFDENNIWQGSEPHLLAMRKIGENRIEVADSATGKRRVVTLDEAALLVDGGGSPWVTGGVYEFYPGP